MKIKPELIITLLFILFIVLLFASTVNEITQSIFYIFLFAVLPLIVILYIIKELIKLPKSKIIELINSIHKSTIIVITLGIIISIIKIYIDNKLIRTINLIIGFIAMICVFREFLSKPEDES